MTTDPAERIQRQRDAMRAKAAQALANMLAADHDGQLPEQSPPDVEPASAVGPVTPPRPSPDRLRPGGLVNDPPPSLAQQITDAERSGDWDTARALKLQQLTNLAIEMNGAV